MSEKFQECCSTAIGSHGPVRSPGSITETLLNFLEESPHHHQDLEINWSWKKGDFQSPRTNVFSPHLTFPRLCLVVNNPALQQVLETKCPFAVDKSFLSHFKKSSCPMRSITHQTMFGLGCQIWYLSPLSPLGIVGAIRLNADPVEIRVVYSWASKKW